MTLVFDGHNDTLVALHSPGHPYGDRSFFERSERGHIDFPRAQEGELGGGFFAICVPDPEDEHDLLGSLDVGEGSYDIPLPPALDPSYAREFTKAVMADLFRWEAESGGRLRVARSVEDIRGCFRDNAIAAVLHFEGAEAIDPALESLERFYEAGLRSLGIAWSRPSAFATGAPFRFPGSGDDGPGLSERGKELVRTCNELGIVLDLSHLNERGFWDVAGLSDAPLVVTHTAAHALCPSSRNLTDSQIDAVGESGGVVGVIFHVGNLRPDGRQDAETPLSEIVRHVMYITGRIGVDHVALGSDFDGAIMPSGLGDVAGLPRLIEALRASEFDEASLRKVAQENWLRVLAETWKE